MEIDRNRFQRKTSLSRGSSTYVSSANVSSLKPAPAAYQPAQSGAVQAEPVPAVSAAAISPLAQMQPPVRQQVVPVAVKPSAVLVSQSRTPTPASQVDQRQVDNGSLLSDEEGSVFNTWITSAEDGHVARDAPLPQSSGVYDEQHIQLKPEKRRWHLKRRKAGHPFLKPVLYVLGVFALFGLSVGAGMVSGRSTTAQNNNQTSQSQKQTQAPQQQATAQQPGGLSVSQSSSLLGAAQGLGSQAQGTSSGIDVKQYSDTYKGDKINITVQAQPDNFRSDPAGALKNFAANLGAKDSIQTNYGTAYILTKDNVQLIVFVGGSKLVLMQSFGVHSLPEWVTYINAMNP